MPETKKARLRIYCICGQKMKVSEDMYGLPGKCIACRQKIRLPRLDEVPEGATEIFLKDHPHLLRKSKRPRDLEKETLEAQEALSMAIPLRKESTGEDTPITELDIDDAGDERHASQSRSVPLDYLEPLGRVVSLERKLQRKQQVLDKYKNGDKTLKAEVKGQLSQVRIIRGEIDEQLRQFLMETAIDLTSTQEKISQTQVSARVGEIPFQQYQDTVYRLRSRRDQLERRQLNLRGWLATSDPHVVGEYVDLSIGDLPNNGQRITLPPEPGADEPLLQSHAHGLRDALEKRSVAERQLEEVKRMEATSPESDSAIEEAQSEARAKRRQAKARAIYYQGRLKQLKQDLNGDLETIDSQMDAARDRLGISDIDRAEFDRIEAELKQAKMDIMKGLSVADRALTANTPQDVPKPQGTFLERLGFAGSDQSKPAVLMTWAAALCLGLTIFLPAVSNLSLFQAFVEFGQTESSGTWVLLLPLVGAIGIGLTGLLSQPVMRGAVQIGWLGLLIFVSAYIVHEAFYSLDPMAARFRSGTAWPFRPGFFFGYLSALLLGTAAFISLGRNAAARTAALAFSAVVVLASVFLFTDGFGALRPDPAIEISLGEPDVDRQEQSATVWIENNGKRDLHLVNRRSDARNSYVYSLDRRIGANSWSEVPPVADAHMSDAGISGGVYTVAAGERLALNFLLEPDAYRVQLIAGASDEAITMPFDVAMPAAAAALPPEIDPTGSAADDAPIDDGMSPVDTVSESNSDEDMDDALTEPLFPDAAAPISDETIAENQAELKGILTSPDGSQRFSMMLTEKDGSVSRVMLSLGDELWQDWTVTEFNPTRGTVTIQSDGRLLILRRGSPVSLD
jgi:hypothetical protein